MKDELYTKLMDDMCIFGHCITKTEIIDGVVHIDRVAPTSDEMEIVMNKMYHLKDSDGRTYSFFKWPTD